LLGATLFPLFHFPSSYGSLQMAEQMRQP
jgi:hypothetical protein